MNYEKFDRHDPWKHSRQELAAYTAMESDPSVPLEIVHRNLRREFTSRDTKTIIQAVVDRRNRRKK